MRWRSSVINLAGLLSLAVLFGCLFSNTAFAKLEVPAAPPLERPIIDQMESLANEDIDRIAQLINAERQKKSFQIGVFSAFLLDFLLRFGISTNSAGFSLIYPCFLAKVKIFLRYANRLFV